MHGKESADQCHGTAASKFEFLELRQRTGVTVCIGKQREQTLEQQKHQNECNNVQYQTEDTHVEIFAHCFQTHICKSLLLHIGFDRTAEERGEMGIIHNCTDLVFGK